MDGPILGGALVRDNVHLLSKEKERGRLNVAMLIIWIFGVLMVGTLFAATLWESCSGRGMEALNLLGHVFGPLLGMIVGYYFAAELRPK
jgi:fluoride ion exporter CrcB/FEX